MNVNNLNGAVIGAAVKVHSALGPGLLESSYKECLYYEIMKTGLAAEKEKGLPLVYESVRLDIDYRIDLLVAGQIVVEIKAVEKLCEIHLAQILTYLKLSRCRVGLLLNFNEVSMKNGIKRVVL